MGQQQGPSLSDIAFNLTFTSKSFARAAKKAEKSIISEKKKVKLQIEKGNLDGARIFAQNAIRKKNEALNYHRLSARMDAVAERVKTAVRMNSVTESMTEVVAGMDLTLQTMNPDKISMVMDKFEQQFEDLDVRSKYMEDAMQSTSTLSTPEDQVNDLIGQVVDEHSLQVDGEIGEVLKGRIGNKQEQAPEPINEADDLSKRLANLKNQDM